MDALILADDLSGAADCAAAAGHESVVALDWPPLPPAAVVAVDLNSRKEPAAVAAARATRAVQQLVQPQTQIVYQKVDSLLRGNWPFELVAIRAALGALRGAPPLAVLSPAWPERGRTLLDGEVLLDGARLSSIGLESDCGSSLGGSLAAALHDAGIHTIAVRSGASRAALCLEVSAAAESGIAAIICDAQSRADLDAIAAASLTLGDRAFWVGSGGLMGSLSNALGWLPGRPTFGGLAGGPVLVVVGSASQVSHRQLARLRQSGTHVIAVRPADLDANRLAAIAAEIASKLAVGSNLAIALDSDGRPDLRIGASLVQALVDLLAPFVPKFGGLILTGGETARAILAVAGVNAIRVLGEVEPGVPVGISIGALRVPVITKAGAFGGPDTLVRALAVLQDGIGRSESLPLQPGMST